MSLPHDRLVRGALVAGAVGLVGCVVVALVDRRAAFEGWLVTWLFLLGLSLAGMAQVMIHELTGGDWGRVLRPPLEAATAALPLVALLAVPLAFGLPDLFPWARPEAAVHTAALEPQQWFLAPARFIVRNAVLLAVWCAFAIAFVGVPLRAGPMVPRRALAIVGLLVYLFTVTLAAYDWVASEIPGWASTAIGVRLGTTQFMGSLAFAVVFVVLLRPGVRESAPRRDFQDFGNLLLTYAMMWAYIAFTQYLIVWAEDLPDETSWFWPRAATSWRFLVWLVVALEFALPVGAMLFRRVKRDPRLLALVCALTLAGQWVDTFWLVVPSLRTHGVAFHVADGLALLGEGGLWLAAVLYLAARIPVAAPVAPSEVKAHG